MPSADRPGGAAEDPRLLQLKRSVDEGTFDAVRTVWTVASGVLVCCAGGLLVAGALVPWLSIAGASLAPIRQGGPDGAAATWCVAVGVLWVLLGAVAAVGRRGRPRFLHWLTWLLAPLTFALVHYRSQILGQLVFVHNIDLSGEGVAATGPGTLVVYAGVALGLAAPLLSLRQAWRVLRT